MAKMQLLQQFTIEVPRQNGENEIIKGSLVPETKALLKEIGAKFEPTIKKGKRLQKLVSKGKRLEQEIESFTQIIDLTQDQQSKLKLVEKKQALFVELYNIQDEMDQLAEELQGQDSEELRAKEHIQRRLVGDEVTKTKITELCDKYSYSMVFNTILEDISEGK